MKIESSHAKNTEMPMSLAYIELLLAVAFWGAAFAAMKVAAFEVGIVLGVFMRMILGILVLVPFVVYRGDFRAPTRKEAIYLLLLGFQGVMLHHNMQFYAMTTAGAGNANWYIAATPSLVAVLGLIFLGEKFSGKTVLGLLISGFGVLTVVGLGTKGLSLFRAGGIGELWMAVSALNWAIFQVLSRRLLGTMRPAFAVLWINIFAAIMQSVLLFAFYDTLPTLGSISQKGWIAVLFLGIFCSGLGYIFWYDGLSVMPVVRVSAFQFIQPIFGVAAAYFITGERFTVFTAIGGVMVLLGVSLVNKRNTRRQ